MNLIFFFAPEEIQMVFSRLAEMWIGAEVEGWISLGRVNTLFFITDTSNCVDVIRKRKKIIRSKCDETLQQCGRLFVLCIYICTSLFAQGKIYVDVTPLSALSWAGDILRLYLWRVTYAEMEKIIIIIIRWFHDV